MMSNRKVRIIAVLLAVCLLVPMLVACGEREKEAGYEALDSKDDRVIIIKAVAGEGKKADVTVRRIEQDKETKLYNTVEEYIPEENGDFFAVNVQEKGVYEVEASCDGMETAKYTVVVGNEKVYNLFFDLNPVETETSETAETSETSEVTETVQ